MLYVMVCFCTVEARDPFSYEDGYHSVSCLQIGILDNRQSFARIFYDGLVSLVHVRDQCGPYEVIRITKDNVVLKDTRSRTHQIMLSL